MKNDKTKLIEKELISRLISSENLIIQALPRVTTEDFQHFGKQFQIISDCYRNNKNISTEFQINGFKLSDFLDEYSFRPIDIICNEIKEISNSLKLGRILKESIQNIPDENIDEYVSDIQRKIITGVSSVQKEKTDIDSIVKEYEDRKDFYKEKYKNGDKIVGIPTGYESLDKIIDGIRPEHLWVIGGYTNTGKTAASLNLVASLIKQGKKVVFYSLEMGNTDILSRLIGIMSNDSGLSIMKGFAKDENKVKEVIEKIKKSNLSIHTTKSNLSEIQYSMYEENMKQHVDLFVVDFLQLVTVKGAKSEYETINAATLEFQMMAKRLKTTVILLSQVSNDGAKYQDDVVMSFKGSGSIAAAADFAIELQIGEEDRKVWKQKVQNGEPVLMKWQIRKNRHGKTGYVQMMFDGKTGIFELSELENF